MSYNKGERIPWAAARSIEQTSDKDVGFEFVRPRFL